MRQCPNTEDINLVLERVNSSSVKIINKWPNHLHISSRFMEILRVRASSLSFRTYDALSTA